jgi:hypothetical protein
MTKKSQCEKCHHDTCGRVGERSLFDGSRHTCRQHQPKDKETRDAEARKQLREWQKTVEESFDDDESWSFLPCIQVPNKGTIRGGTIIQEGDTLSVDIKGRLYVNGAKHESDT